jgi:hypothetical protein
MGDVEELKKLTILARKQCIQKQWVEVSLYFSKP